MVLLYLLMRLQAVLPLGLGRGAVVRSRRDRLGNPAHPRHLITEAGRGYRFEP